MSSRKREAPETTSDWFNLGAEDAEEDPGVGRSDGEDEEDLQDSRSRAHKTTASKTKRRKLDFGLDSDSEGGTEAEESEDEDAEDGPEHGGRRKDVEQWGGASSLTISKGQAQKRLESETSGVEVDDNDEPRPSPKAEKTKKTLSTKDLERSTKAASKTGVVYISRIPPFMNIHDLKRLLSPFGTLGRIFLTPEDPNTRLRRKRTGGSTRPCFVDGWIEFMSKKDAKKTVELLNTRTIGGSKRGAFHDDVWNLKYLTGFKWHHLTEQIANENAERAAKLRAQIAKTTRENKVFVENVEKAKVVRGIEDKRRERGLEVGPERKGKDGKAFQQHFVQNKVLSKGAPSSGAGGEKGVLTKIF